MKTLRLIAAAAALTAASMASAMTQSTTFTNGSFDIVDYHRVPLGMTASVVAVETDVLVDGKKVGLVPGFEPFPLPSTSVSAVAPRGTRFCLQLPLAPA